MEDVQMELFAIRRRSAWVDSKALEAAAAKSTRIGNEDMPDQVRWIRSYVVNEPDGKLGTICIYEARDAESIHEHARRVGMPSDEVTPIGATVVVREDPKA
jgi:hypothetical protein